MHIFTLRHFFAGEKDSGCDATPLLLYQINNQIYHDTLQCDIVFILPAVKKQVHFTLLMGTQIQLFSSDWPTVEPRTRRHRQNCQFNPFMRNEMSKHCTSKNNQPKLPL